MQYVFRINRPLSLALNDAKKNEIIHLDFIYMGESNYGFKYTVFIKDDSSSYVQLSPTSAVENIMGAKQLQKLG